MTTTNELYPAITNEKFTAEFSTFENTKEVMTAFACLTFFPAIYLIGNLFFR